jgi:hypothetical protein
MEDTEEGVACQGDFITMYVGGESVELTPGERVAFVQAAQPLLAEVRVRFGEAFVSSD